MKPALACALIFASLSIAAPLAAAVDGFVIVNRTGAALRKIEVRRVGSGEWQILAITAAAGATARSGFAHPDCAFDLRAVVADAGSAVWSGVNLCDVKSVTLNRDTSGRTWVDYD